MGTFNKRETSGNHHYVSLILFSSHSPARRGGKWNRFEDLWNPSSRRPVEFFSNSFQFLAHFNAWKTSSSPDSSWIASSRKYLIRLNIYIYILFQIFIFHSKLPITKPFLFVSNINIRISQIILRFLPRSISGSSRILPRIQEKFVGSVLAEAMKDSSKNKANGRNWAVV